MTRIIAGEFGGQRLTTPNSSRTRPTADRVREALFSVLDHDNRVADASVLDLYAGSGALGLEALSRGAAEATFVDAAAPAVKTIRYNIARIGDLATDATAGSRRAGSARADSARAPTRVVKSGADAFLANDDDSYDLVLVDPPYNMSEGDLTRMLGALAARLNPGATVVLERATRSGMPAWPKGLHGWKTKRYGDTKLWWAGPAEPAAAGPAEPAAAGPAGPAAAARSTAPARSASFVPALPSELSGPEVPAEPSGDADVAGFAEALGLPGLFDVHTHFMPQNVLDKVWRYFETNDEYDWPIAYRLDEADRVARLGQLGVRRFTAMLYPHKPGMARWLNDWASDFAARTPAAVHTATFYPEVGAPDYVDAALAAGARIFKAHVQVGDYDPADERLDGVWARLQAAGVPTVIHCGSGPNRGRFTGPGPIRDVLGRFGELKLIIAHLGMPEYEEFLDLACEFEGVYLDTTMNFTDFIEGMMPFPDRLRGRLFELGEKILLGSDFPNIPYPYAHQIVALQRLGLGADWLRGVLWHNAARLLDEPTPA